MNRFKIGLSMLIVMLSFNVMGQKQLSEKITDKWPYLYQEFHEGILYFDGVKKSKANFNIDLVNQVVNYFEEDGKIKTVSKSVSIDSLVLDEVKFIKSDDMIYQILSEEGNLSLLKKIRIDLNALKESGGAYGSGSSTSATTNLTSVDVSNYTGVAYEVVKLEKGKGKPFDMITGYYLSTDHNQDFQRASKKTFSQAFPDSDVKGIIKANKMKLKNESHLQLLFLECVK